MSSSRSIALIMAAGSSRRFGSDKRLATLSDGRSLLLASIAAAEEAFDGVRVVLSRHDAPARLGIPDDTPLIISAMSERGLGASIADAFKALCQQPDTAYNSAAVWLGDMPWIQAQTCRRLVRLSTPDNIVRPIFNGQPGHPVLFGRRFWEALSIHAGRSGGQPFVDRFRDRLRCVQVEDPGVIRDIDLPGDLTDLH